MDYQPTKNSIRYHRAPPWFHDAKFGIFIHWSLSSVPGFAPVTNLNLWELIRERGFREHFRLNPYAEWYLNTLKIPGSPTADFHRRTYGPNFSYDDFAPMFNQAMAAWDPAAWADLFCRVGARYVVLVTKHHDGFLLWPSTHPNPFKQRYCAARDVVSELTAAVTARGMKMGFYYSGGLDWTFNPKPITDAASMLANGPVSREYADYVDAHFRELIARHRPAILWNDICYPARGDLYRLLAHYYKEVPDGVVNDRWAQVPAIAARAAISWPWRPAINWAGMKLVAKMGMTMPRPPAFADYTTPEYITLPKSVPHKWECVRGIAYSFGYNRMETEEHYLTADAAVRMLADVVSKNGNLLLDVGPMADGTIPAEQVQCLEGIGEWLRKNGEAIYGTRPWTRAEGMTRCGVPIRFTCKEKTIYAILLATPSGDTIEIPDVPNPAGEGVRLLGHEELLSCSSSDGNLVINLPGPLGPAPAHVLALS